MKNTPLTTKEVRQIDLHLQCQDYQTFALNGLLENMNQNKLVAYATWLVLSRMTSSSMAAVQIDEIAESLIGEEFDAFSVRFKDVVQSHEEYRKSSILGTIQHVRSYLLGN